ncbi:NADH-quinone oxidoreductase subunit NuoE [Chloroflexota bacterium]
MAKIEKAITRQGKERGRLLALLKQAQGESGYVSEKSILTAAQSLDISIGEVYGVTTFYSYLSSKPLGRNVIRVCKNLPCYLKNSQIIIDCLADELGVEPGETTPDGKFSLLLTNCIGGCDGAPAMLINDDIHMDLTPDKISGILKAYK